MFETHTIERSESNPDKYGRIFQKEYSIRLIFPEWCTPLIERIINLGKSKKQVKKVDLSFKNYSWRSFFCLATGEMIDSREKARDLERRGLIAMKPDEIKREAAKYRNYKKQEHSVKIRKKCQEALRQINQGRSFFKEMAMVRTPDNVKAFNEKK